MDFRLLGPFSAWDGDRELPLGGSRQRALLAVLVLRANQLVPTSRLVEELWGDRPPRAATKTVQVYVSQLRKLLGADAVETRPPGYVLPLAPDAVDATRFERALKEARPLVGAGAFAEAERSLREALALWRGDPLADFRYEPFAQAEIARLEEVRLGAVELWLEALVALNRHLEAVPELEALVRAHPLRENLRRLLMLALYRSGRQADALAAYQEARAALVEELGLEPSEALQRLEKAILVQDAALAADAPAVPAAAPVPAAPAVHAPPVP